MKFFVFLGLLLNCMNIKADIVEIFSTKSKNSITFNELVHSTINTKFFILGEYHNDPLIQSAEKEIIETISIHHPTRSKALMWEFLDHTDQSITANQFQLLKAGSISSLEFISNTAGKQNSEYAVIFEAMKNFSDLEVFGVNLPRSLKQKVMKDGINSIDPKYIPDVHYVGGPLYLERFELSMGGHVPQDKLAKYFLAQCLTDSVMANEVYENQKDLNFLIAGSFHTDFFDATIARLNKLTSNEVTSFKIVNKKDLNPEDITELKSGHANYGHYADYIIFTE